MVECLWLVVNDMSHQVSNKATISEATQELTIY